MCQIGAAVMADRGHKNAEILSHYFKGAEILALY
jgi:peptidoglycan hydrolase-like amidase